MYCGSLRRRSINWGRVEWHGASLQGRNSIYTSLLVFFSLLLLYGSHGSCYLLSSSQIFTSSRLYFPIKYNWIARILLRLHGRRLIVTSLINKQHRSWLPFPTKLFFSIHLLIAGLFSIVRSIDDVHQTSCTSQVSLFANNCWLKWLSSLRIVYIHLVDRFQNVNLDQLICVQEVDELVSHHPHEWCQYRRFNSKILRDP